MGETGCGKTALVQRLAEGTGRELVVQNLSLQTDGADLLGGFRPVELRQLAQVSTDRSASAYRGFFFVISRKVPFFEILFPQLL